MCLLIQKCNVTFLAKSSPNCHLVIHSRGSKDNAVIDCVCPWGVGEGRVPAHRLAFVISGFSTGLCFLLYRLPSNLGVTKRGHSQFLCKQTNHRRNSRLFLVFPMTTWETQDEGPCSTSGRPSLKGSRVHKPHKHFWSSLCPNPPWSGSCFAQKTRARQRKGR